MIIYYLDFKAVLFLKKCRETAIEAPESGRKVNGIQTIDFGQLSNKKTFLYN